MIEYIYTLFFASLVNLYFGFIAIILGFSLSVLLAFGLTRKRGLIYYLTSSYVYFFRGSPLFIQLYFFYFTVRATGIQAIKSPETNERIFAFVVDALFLAPVVLFLNTGAYAAVIFANALRAVPKNDLEAADAYGFSKWKKFWRITWPSMLRIAWPAYTNEVVFLFLSTTLVYGALPVTVRPNWPNVKDVFVIASDTAEKTFNPFFAYLPAMAIFVVMILCIFYVFGLVNQYLNRHLPILQRGPRLRFRPNFMR